MAPARDTRPKVGRNPVTPQRIAGLTIDPSVSEPIAKPANPALTALAEPALDPEEPADGYQVSHRYHQHQSRDHPLEHSGPFLVLGAKGKV